MLNQIIWLYFPPTQHHGFLETYPLLTVLIPLLLSLPRPCVYIVDITSRQELYSFLPAEHGIVSGVVTRLARQLFLLAQNSIILQAK